MLSVPASRRQARCGQSAPTSIRERDTGERRAAGKASTCRIVARRPVLKRFATRVTS
jgi:hypothetical protein